MGNGILKDIRDSASVKATNKAISKPNENTSSLIGVKYACCYWVNHLVDALQEQERKKIPISEDQRNYLSDGGTLHQFLQLNLLHWFFALCMMRQGVDCIRMLTTLAFRLVSIPIGSSS
jgi:hypothetical protein